MRLQSQIIVSDFIGDGVVGNTDGVGTTSRLNQPLGLALSSDDSILYFVDYMADTLRQVIISTGMVQP